MRKTSASDGRKLDDFSRRLNLPYLIGAYLAVNAVPDLFLLVDGPDCILHKAEFIHGKHDWNSTLLDAGGEHRIVFSNVTVNDVAADWGGRLAGMLRLVRSRPGCGAVLLTSMPVCGLTGLQYDKTARELNAEKARGAPVIPVASGSGDQDWLDGYAETLAALAAHLPLPRSRKRKRGGGRVAVVGLMMDRTEEDHLGNVRELRRMLRALDLDAVSFWPGGEPLSGLARIAQADAILSLPYGRKAARILARRTGARLVELGLPFGLDGSARWLLRVAGAFGRKRRAEEVVRAERARAGAKLEWVIPYAFLNRRVSVFLDPHLASAALGLAGELGLEVKAAAAVGREGHLPRSERGRLLCEPRRAALEAVLREPGDLVIGTSLAIADEALSNDAAVVELGFPSWHTHALVSSPFLGFEGFLCLADRMSNALGARTLAQRGP